jgi:Flp pilus assembly protein TadG
LLQLHRFTRDEQGLQLVEAAIVVPVFLILFAATAEFGRFFYEYTTLAKAARVGSRYLATNPLTPAHKETAKNIIVYGNAEGSGSPLLTGLDKTHVVITTAGGVAVLPDTVTVQIEGYTFQPLLDLGLFTKSKDLSLNVDVSPSVTMRYLLTQPPELE